MSASLSTKSGASNSDDSGTKPVPCKTEILFRVWTGSTQNNKLSFPGDVSEEPSGIVAFLQDVVASRQGVLVPTEENMFVSILEDAPQALVVARQVQLGIQDFQRKSKVQPIAVSIAIDASATGVRSLEPDVTTPSQDSTQNSPAPCIEASHDLLTLIRMSRPAQILLTHELFQKVNLFRGLPLKTFQGRFGVFEYLWTGEEKLLELEGDPTRFSNQEPAPDFRSERAHLPAMSSRATEDESARTPFASTHREKENTEAIPFWRSPLGVGSAVAMLLLVLIAGGVALRVSGTKADTQKPSVVQHVTPAAKDPSVPPKVIQTTQPPVPLPGPVEKPRKTIQAPQPKPKESRKESAVSAAENTDTPGTPPKTCSIPSSLDDYLRQAEISRGRGDYPTAERLFNRVLECDPNNDVAKHGLNRTRAAEKK